MINLITKEYWGECGSIEKNCFYLIKLWWALKRNLAIFGVEASNILKIVYFGIYDIAISIMSIRVLLLTLQNPCSIIGSSLIAPRVCFFAFNQLHLIYQKIQINILKTANQNNLFLFFRILSHILLMSV